MEPEYKLMLLPNLWILPYSPQHYCLNMDNLRDAIQAVQ